LAIQILKKAIEVSPNFKGYYDLLWKIYWHAGENKLALEVVRNELELYPGDEYLRGVLRCGLPSIKENEIFSKVLRYDLENMVSLIRSNGARPIISNYPFDKGDTDMLKILANE